MKGILLRRIRFSDSSLIVTWLTDEAGKIKTIAKGALRQKSAFAGKLDLFYQTELLYAESSRSEIHTLREVALSRMFENIRTDYTKMLAAAYFCELTEAVTELEHPVAEIYDLLTRALNYLDVKPLEYKAIAWFDSELCRMLGILPQTKSKAESESKRIEVPVGAHTLLSVYGRLPSCRLELQKRLTKKEAD